MAAYLIFEAGEVLDGAAVAEYVRRVPAVVRQYDGTYLAQGTLEVLEGDHPAVSTVIIAFPSMERLKEFYASAEYAPLKEIRRRGIKGNFLLLNGV
jgi:uncharacterized protein (DUF1330 family)